jgi:hypothetical protein
MKTKVILTSLALIAILSLFTTCKKYPENTVWFKNPTDIPVIQGHITAYVVNGIDSLDLLNLYYAPVIPNAVYPYGNPVRDVKTEKFTITGHAGNYYSVSSDLFDGNLSYTWSSDKKSINIGGTALPYYYNKQIFIKNRSGEVVWQIVYLDKNGKKSKIKTTYNDVVYEITFEN